MKRILIAGLAGALGASLAGVSAGEATAQQGAATIDGVATRDATTQKPVTKGDRVRWGKCPAGSYDWDSYGIECAKIRVPLDYQHPRRGTIKLEISRKKHNPKAGKYKGILLVNPGGPGGSGLIMPAYQGSVPGDSAQQYDWIGFDPRGVGASGPALHCNPKYFGTNRPSYVPKTHKLMKFWRTKARGYARDCGRSNARRLLGQMTTADNARDMESIRKALGRRKISFYGFSWGTYLGTTYATLFPHRVKRMVLDGVVNPHRVWYGANLDQDRAFDRNMDRYWRYLAKHDDAFHLGTEWKQIRRGYYRLLRELDKHPAADGRLGPDELGDAMLSAGYYVYDWVDIGKAYAALVNRGQGGDLFRMYKGSSMGRDAENGYAVYSAVQCTDAPWPGWGKTRRDSWRTHRKAPFLTWGNTWYNAPCLNWAAPSQRQPRITGRHVNANVLMISETDDAATPYSGAIAMRELFPTASLIAGVNGTTHAGSLSGVACVDNRIAKYLGSGRVPPRRNGNRADVYCPHVPAPQPAADGTTSRRTVPELREALQSAQLPMLR
jgi:pimeloyl-ACP methyl ester carboxylesterase